MCLTCSEHLKNIWYLKEENHKSSYSIRDRIYSYKMPQIAEAAARYIFFKKQDFSKLEDLIINLYSRNVHGGQIIPSLDQTMEIIDLAHDVALTYCICLKALTRGKREEYKCIYLNTATQLLRKCNPDKTIFIDKDKAKQIVLQKRKEGNFQAVLWGPHPAVASICNCNSSCGSFQMPSVLTAFVPSIFKAKVIDCRKCTRCKACVEWCYFHALTVNEMGISINPLKCAGCGLCIERCSQKVIGFALRSDYFDPISRKWIGPNAKLAFK